MKYISEILLGLLLLFSSCSKYLDAVPDSSLTIPRTVADFEQLLQNDVLYNNSPSSGEFGSDDLYLPDALYATQAVEVRNGYIWAKDIDEGSQNLHWSYAYNKIYYANVVLEGLEKLPANGASGKDIDLIKGWALFCRAYAFFDLAQLFAKPYQMATAGTDLGIPLKLNSNLSEKSTRSTVDETYKQILSDLNSAAALLPDEFFKSSRNKPGKAAAYALLSRVYLNMQEYSLALESVQQSLKRYDQLVDYNLYTPSTGLTFNPLVDEVIYISSQISYSIRSWQIDRALYNSFSTDDLRKTLFFTQNAATGVITFKGFYNAMYAGFNGLATDELYLTKAECQARLTDESTALATLNALLVKRYRKGFYIPYTLSNTPNVLQQILQERRKECIFRNLRWSDLRRFNQDPKLAKTLTRTVNNISYQLAPNDSRYVLPIPQEEIRLSGIQPNVR